jgi:hypothetical protein
MHPTRSFTSRQSAWSCAAATACSALASIRFPFLSAVRTAGEALSERSPRSVIECSADPTRWRKARLKVATAAEPLRPTPHGYWSTAFRQSLLAETRRFRRLVCRPLLELRRRRVGGSLGLREWFRSSGFALGGLFAAGARLFRAGLRGPQPSPRRPPTDAAVEPSRLLPHGARLATRRSVLR